MPLRWIAAAFSMISARSCFDCSSDCDSDSGSGSGSVRCDSGSDSCYS